MTETNGCDKIKSKPKKFSVYFNKNENLTKYYFPHNYSGENWLP